MLVRPQLQIWDELVLFILGILFGIFGDFLEKEKAVCEHWFQGDRLQESQLLKGDRPMRGDSLSTAGFLAAGPFENRKTK